MGTVFVITAYRWGNRDNHSYVVGVFSSMKLAKARAYDEEKDRGGKYKCHIVRTQIDQNEVAEG